MNDQINRPDMTLYDDPISYIGDMLGYLRRKNPLFSIKKKLKSIEDLSPTLVSLILKNKRKITVKKAPLFSELMELTNSESFMFENWIHTTVKSTWKYNEKSELAKIERPFHILKDWVNFYVRDAFYIKEIQKNPELIYELFSPTLDKQRISKSIDNLLESGILIRDADGTIFSNKEVSGVFTYKNNDEAALLQALLKEALNNAKEKLDISTSKDEVSSCFLNILTLDKRAYADIKKLLNDFHLKLIEKFKYENSESQMDNIYQVYMNITALSEFESTTSTQQKNQ